MIKLIATDLDGTLFYPKKRITVLSKENRKFLKEFIDNGGKVVLVSGRNAAVLPKVEKKVGHSISLLGCNGSFLIEDGQLKDEHPLPNDVCLEVYNKLKNNFGIIAWFLFDNTPALYVSIASGISSALLTVSKIYNLTLGVYKEKLIFGEKKFVKKLAEGKNFKLMPIFGLGKSSYVKAKQAFMAINDLYKDKITVCCTDNSLEMTALGMNKAVGLSEYINNLGIDKSEVAVVGDSGNDLVMFKNFENSFCMEHSEQEIKNQAKYIVKRVYILKDYIDKI